MGRTSSTTHRWLYHVKATSATLLTTNLVVLIEVKFMGEIGNNREDGEVIPSPYRPNCPNRPNLLKLSKLTISALLIYPIRPIPPIFPTSLTK